MSRKLEFVKLAEVASEPFSQLCKRFNISRKTGYQLIERYKKEGEKGLLERSRRSHTNPDKTRASIEEKIIKVRGWKRTWGGRKIRRWLLDQGEEVLAVSTITNILRRNGYLSEEESSKRRQPIRFEHEAPNDLWQMDFKGHFEIGRGRCYPLTVLDDHSRYSIGLKACGSERSEGVKNHLMEIFRAYGIPLRMNMDNGTPWACSKGHLRYTSLSIWLIRLGIRVNYSRIRHPQTNGKDERFHRTLKSELLQFNYFKDLKDAQISFDCWREEYNIQRPHEALNLDTPVQHFYPSKRSFPEQLPPIEYREKDIVRKVDLAGKIGFKNNKFFVSEALRGEYIALREINDEQYSVFFCDQRISVIDLRSKRAIE